VIQRAESGTGHDDYGQGEIPRPVPHFIIGGEGDAPASHAFDSQMGEAGLEDANGLVLRCKINRSIFGLGCDQRGRRFPQMHRIDFVECQDIPGSFANEHRILAVTGADRLECGGVTALSAP